MPPPAPGRELRPPCRRQGSCRHRSRLLLLPAAGAGPGGAGGVKASSRQQPAFPLCTHVHLKTGSAAAAGSFIAAASGQPGPSFSSHRQGRLPAKRKPQTHAYLRSPAGLNPCGLRTLSATGPSYAGASLPCAGRAPCPAWVCRAGVSGFGTPPGPWHLQSNVTPRSGCLQKPPRPWARGCECARAPCARRAGDTWGAGSGMPLGVYWRWREGARSDPDLPAGGINPHVAMCLQGLPQPGACCFKPLPGHRAWHLCLH